MAEIGWKRCWMGHVCCTQRSVHTHETIPRKCRACKKAAAQRVHPTFDPGRAPRVR